MTARIPFVTVASKPQSFVVDITPAVATLLLQTIDRQRPLKEGVAEKYGRDMAAGNWLVTNSGIGFDKKGHLIDGQHRLWGCVDADVNFRTMVTIGLEEEAREVIDVGLKRSIGDVISMRSGERLPPLYVSTGRWMMSLKPSEALRTDTLDFLERHRKAIAFVMDGLPRVAKITIAPVLAVVGRAYYTQSEDELRRFLKNLIGPLPEGHFPEPALILRDWLLRRNSRGGSTTQAEVYYKTETALHHFLTKKKLSRLYEAKGELFPLTRSRS